MPSYTQYKRQVAVVDANEADIESWITVKGNHIPIMKGQSKEDAVKSFLENKGGNSIKRESAKQRNENFEKAKSSLPKEKVESYLDKIGGINKKYDRLYSEASTKQEKEKILKEWSKNGNEVVKEMTNKAKESQKAREKYGIKEVIKPDIEKKGSVSIVSKGSGKGKYKIGETVKQGKILAIQKANLSDTPYYQIEKPDGKKEWLIEEEVKPETKYDPEFEVVRKNALANSSLYGGRYTQKSKAEAYKAYKNDTSSKEDKLWEKARKIVESRYGNDPDPSTGVYRPTDFMTPSEYGKYQEQKEKEIEEEFNKLKNKSSKKWSGRWKK
jgi:hypothetical protein